MENRGRVPSLSLFGINQSTMHSQLVNWEFGIIFLTHWLFLVGNTLIQL